MTVFRYLINTLYHRPKGYLRTVFRFGIYNYLSMRQGQKAMKTAAEKLRFLDSESRFELHFLTGKNYLYQTLFCIKSLELAAKESFTVHLYDDGTFSDRLIAQISNQIPGAVIHHKKDIDHRLAAHLPAERFPYLNKKRSIYPHIKKLTDIHCGSAGWKLVLDSDMLFNRNPEEMMTWLSHPTSPVCMQDCVNAYGFPKSAMEALTGNPIIDLMNVGIIGIQSESINWENVEKWASELESTFGNSYYLEQGLTAMILSGKKCIVLPPENYVVNPTRIGNAMALHFVDLSKALYFRKAWKNITAT